MNGLNTRWQRLAPGLGLGDRVVALVWVTVVALVWVVVALVWVTELWAWFG